MIAVRAIDEFEVRRLSGTEGASYPFWSPDSREVAFFSQGKLKKVAADGGPVQVLTDAPQALGGTWNTDGVIVFSGRGQPLRRVSADGGQPEPVHPVAAGQGETLWPQFLSDGRFIYLKVGSDENRNGIYLGSLDSPDETMVVGTESAATYSGGSFNNSETGRQEVYVVSYPQADQRWQVSVEGGVQPRWRADGREMYYLAPDGTMMSVNVEEGSALRLSRPQPLFRTRTRPSGSVDEYDVTPDGSRFIVVQSIASAAPPPPRRRRRGFPRRRPGSRPRPVSGRTSPRN